MYWSGIAYLATSDFKNASKVLAKMIDSFPNGAYAEDGMYRSGVAAFGAGNFEVARDTLEDFVSRYPNSVLRGEVEFFLGDIYANNAHLEYAMKHYGAVEKYTKNENFINNAYIQSAKLLHDAEKYDEEIALMDKYIAKYPKGICSDASFNKAKAFELLAKPADALAIYGDAILKYGANFKDDGVDKMILDYNRMYLENEKKLLY
jgi:TolA-binding protein